MEIGEIIRVVIGFFLNTLESKARVIGVTPTDDGWMARVEVDVEGRDIRKRWFVASYEVLLNRNLEIISFQRKEIVDRSSS